MELILRGHEYRYAVEQSLLNFFPQDIEGTALCTLHVAKRYATGVATLTTGDATVTARARVCLDGAEGDYERVRREQSALKHAIYRAAAQLTGVRPAWGALTGIRPAKLALHLLETGHSEAQVSRVLDKRYGVSSERRALCLSCATAGLAVKKDLQPQEVSLYLGVPFCPTRCAYCSFVSLDVHKSLHLRAPYVDALVSEIEAAGDVARSLGLTVGAVYWGGGTPTTLSPEQLARLMDRLGDCFDLSGVREYTVEAGRPDTLNEPMLDTLYAHGARRLSVNPQTMRDDILENLGRAHTAADIVRAYGQARAAGFMQLNMDLIAGLPGDNQKGFTDSMDAVLALRPENVTVHTLARKRGSRITVNEEPLPSPEEVGAMLDAAGSALTAAGYAPYYLYRQKYMAGSFENVGWSLPGHESRYNVVIMEELQTILSLGAGGVTKLVSPRSGRIERVFNPKYGKEYIENLPRIVEQKQAISAFYKAST